MTCKEGRAVLRELNFLKKSYMLASSEANLKPIAKLFIERKRAAHRHLKYISVFYLQLLVGW